MQREHGRRADHHRALRARVRALEQALLALERLGARKGYRLVGCDTMGVNAFFLRSDYFIFFLLPLPFS